MAKPTNLALREAAYTVDALIDAGVPPQVVMKLRADGSRAIPERAYTRVGPGKLPKTKEPIIGYVWGPDALVLLAEMKEAP